MLVWMFCIGLVWTSWTLTAWNLWVLWKFVISFEIKLFDETSLTALTGRYYDKLHVVRCSWYILDNDLDVLLCRLLTSRKQSCSSRFFLKLLGALKSLKNFMSNADDQQVNDTVIVYIMSSVWSCIIILWETSTSTSTPQLTPCGSDTEGVSDSVS